MALTICERKALTFSAGLIMPSVSAMLIVGIAGTSNVYTVVGGCHHRSSVRVSRPDQKLVYRRGVTHATPECLW